MDKAYLVPNPIAPTQPVIIDPEKCDGCNECYHVCRTQTLMPNPVEGQPPLIIYPDECWYGACCVKACPKDAIKLNYPINQRLFFKRKKTGEVFRLGGPDSPPQSYFEPPEG